MIIKNLHSVRSDGVKLFTVKSDCGFMLRQIETGNLYAEAVDVENAPFTYEETETSVPDDEISTEEAMDILLGGAG